MTKKDHIVIHSIKHHLPAGGLGAFAGVYWISDSIKDGLGTITQDSETIQECITIIQSLLPF